MDVIVLNETGNLFLSPDIDDWEAIESHDITVIIDLDGDLDLGIPTVPNHMLYIYFPIYDDGLPDLTKLHGVAALGAAMIRQGHKVLCHCLMGFNRSALIAALVLVHLGLSGKQAVEQLRDKRSGALYNEVFANYLETLEPMG